MVELVFDDLFKYGLIRVDKKNLRKMSLFKGVHPFGDRISDLGKRFIQFCQSPAI